MNVFIAQFINSFTQDVLFNGHMFQTILIQINLLFAIVSDQKIYKRVFYVNN